MNHRRLFIAPLAASAFAMFIGALVLMGWVLDLPLLKSIVPGWISMKANAALSFLLAGGSLGLFQTARGNRVARILAYLCAALIVLVALLTLMEYLFSVDLRIDQLLFHESSGAIHTPYPGRMSLITTLCFLMLGFALLLLGCRAGLWLVPALAFTSSVFALLSFVRYFLSVPMLDSLLFYTQPAVHTSAALLTLGVGIFLARQTAERPHEPNRPQSAVRESVVGIQFSFVFLFVGLILTLAGWQQTHRVLLQLSMDRFATAVVDIQAIVEKRSATYINTLSGLQGLYVASKSVERDEFSAYCRTLDLWKQHPGLVALSYVERVPAAEKEAFLERVRGDTTLAPAGYPAFQIFPSGQREEYYVVNYVEPYAGNEQAHGFDLSSEAIRRAALERAQDTGEVAGTSRIAMFTDHNREEHASLILLSVYRNGLPHGTVEERRAALVGFVAGVLHTERLFDGLLGGESSLASVELEVFDDDTLTEESLLYDSHPQELRATSTWRGALQALRQVQMGDQSWTMLLSAPSDFGLKMAERLLPVSILWIGILFSILLFSILSSLASARLQAVNLANRMMGDLQTSEQRYASLIDGAPDPIITIDPLGFLRLMNPAAEQISGYSAQELCGRHFASIGLLPPPSLAIALKEFALLLAKAQRPPYELEIICKDQHRIIVEAHSRLMVEKGKLSLIQVIFRDMTQHKQAAAEKDAQSRALEVGHADLVRQQQITQSLLEDVQTTKEQLERQSSELMLANKKLKELTALKDDFVATVSHELRTPLTSVKEGLSLLLDNALGETTTDQQDFLKTMDSDIDRLTELINNMLDISKIEARRMRLQRRRLEVQPLLESLLRSFQPLFGARRIMIECEDVPPVFADRNRMIQVLSNLASNAIKFTTEEGTIIFRAQRRGADMVGISVIDNGAGISTADMPKLFQKFSQVGAQGAGRPRGTGLGLVVCKELVELHKGRIDVESTFGHGTTFTARIPAYSESFALSEGFREMLDLTESEEGKSVAVIAFDLSCAPAGDAMDMPAAVERAVEDMRQHVHRGDIVLPMASRWVVVLAATTADGPDAIIRRLRTVLSASHLPCGAARHPMHGSDAQTLFQHAIRAAGQEIEASDPLASADADPTHVDGAAS